MTIKTILVPLDGNDSVENVMSAAVVVARRFDSHISTIHVSENTLQSVNYVANLSKSLKQSVMDEENQKLEEVSSRIHNDLKAFCDKHRLDISDKAAESSQVTVSWTHAHGSAASTLIDYARLHDVTALKRPQKNKSILRRGQGLSFTENVMVKSGRPVLLVPPQWQAKKCRHAVLAWNQSLESSRAIAMTIPWLSQMEQVSIVVAQSRQTSGEQLVQYLDWHGIEAQIKVLNRKSSTAGKRLLKLCDEINGDFLVMGAYGTARIEQYLFGGVTDYVLNNSEVITVMVH